MAYNEQMTQRLGLMDYILPSNATTASVNSSPGIDFSEVHRGIWIVEVGLIGTSATFDARLQISENSNFNVVANVANSNLTQITAANTIVSVELRSDQVAALAATAGKKYRFARINCTVGTNALNYSVIGLGGDSYQEPASQYNAAAVAVGVVVTP